MIPAPPATGKRSASPSSSTVSWSFAAGWRNFEGGDPDAEVAPLPENIAALQEFLDDDHPASAHLRNQFWGEIDGYVTAVGRRLDRALEISASVRRQGFRLIDGDRV